MKCMLMCYHGSNSVVGFPSLHAGVETYICYKSCGDFLMATWASTSLHAGVETYICYKFCGDFRMETQAILWGFPQGNFS